ncbi:hypothetical protein BKA81DRAFT_219558 [Phyllosticta paracitricarpa]
MQTEKGNKPAIAARVKHTAPCAPEQRGLRSPADALTNERISDNQRQSDQNDEAIDPPPSSNQTSSRRRVVAQSLCCPAVGNAEAVRANEKLAVMGATRENVAGSHACRQPDGVLAGRLTSIRHCTRYAATTQPTAYRQQCGVASRRVED